MRCHEQLTMTPCTDPYCPPTNEHNIGAYNFALLPYEESVIRIYSYDGPKPAQYDLEDFETLAKFAVVHQSYRTGLMPAEIADRVTWKNPTIVEVLREGVGRQPLNAIDKT